MRCINPDVLRISVARPWRRVCHRAIPRYRGIGSEAYFHSTLQGPRPEDARKDGLIIRARYAPLSPASGFPVSRPQQAIRETFGLGILIA